MKALLLLLLSTSAWANAPLPHLNLESKATVSGISSGGFMAMQLLMAESRWVRGAGVVAGGAYGCAEGQLTKALGCMMTPEKVDAAKLVELARVTSEKGQIDPVHGLAEATLVSIHGEKDPTIKVAAQEKLLEFADAFSLKTHKITVPGMGHGFPVPEGEQKCDSTATPWLPNCSIDGAGEILKGLFADLKEPQEPQGVFRSFDQTPFQTEFLLPEGWIFVPKNCGAGEKCHLHIALHGCQQSPEFVQDKFHKLTGYLRWAEANQIVILFPGAKKTRENPNGCWDWWGYSGSDYATKSGKQISAIRAMAQALGISN